MEKTMTDILWKFHNELKEQQQSGRSVTEGNAEIFAETLSAIRSLLLERGIKDKDNVCEFDPRVDIGEVNKAERRGFNQANALWRKMIEEA